MLIHKKIFCLVLKNVKNNNFLFNWKSPKYEEKFTDKCNLKER